MSKRQEDEHPENGSGRGTPRDRRGRPGSGRSPRRKPGPLRRSTETEYVLVRADPAKKTYTLRQGLNTCGRSSQGVQVAFEDETVSRVHAEIKVRGDRIELRDLNARNGTFVNGKRVVTRALRPGDEVRFGSVVLRLERLEQTPAQRNDAHAQHNGRPGARRASPEKRKPRFADHSTLDSAELTWSGPPGGATRRPAADFESGLSDSIGFTTRRRFIAALGELCEFLVTDQHEDHVHEDCLKPIARLFNYRTACLLVLNEAGVPEIESALPSDTEHDELHVSRSLVDRVIRERSAVLVRDAEAELVESARLKGIRSAIVVPLLENDEVMGVLYLDQDDPRRSFGERHLRRLQLLANLVAAKIAQARVRNEMLWAGFIQRSLLREDPRPPDGYEVAFKLEPCVQVGGDFYETLTLPDGRYLIALGDVAGHGAGAALLMANTLATLRALAREAPSPLHLAEHLTELLGEFLRPQGFMTLFLGFLDPKHHTLDYVSAGHEFPALFVPGQPAALIESTGLPIGLPAPVPLEQASVTLPPGALFCVWSDGIPEAMRKCARPPVDFSRERLLEDLDGLRDQPPAHIVRRVFGQVDLFIDCARAQDDRTLLAVRRRSAPVK